MTTRPAVDTTYTAERVRALHHPDPQDPRWCDECGKWMPCPTIRLIDRGQEE